MNGCGAIRTRISAFYHFIRSIASTTPGPPTFESLMQTRLHTTASYYRYLAHTVYLTPLIMAFAGAYLFAAVPQIQEVYLGIIEDVDYPHGIAGLAAISLFSALLYAWNSIEVSARIDAIYPEHADIYFDRRATHVRDLSSAFTASIPFFGLFVGLAQVYRHILDIGESGLGGALGASPTLPGAVMAAVAITLAAYIALVALFYRFRKKSKRRSNSCSFVMPLRRFSLRCPASAPTQP